MGAFACLKIERRLERNIMGWNTAIAYAYTVRIAGTRNFHAEGLIL